MVLAHVLEYTCVMVFHYVIYGVIVSVCYGVCCVMVLTCVMVFAWVMVFFPCYGGNACYGVIPFYCVNPLWMEACRLEVGAWRSS